MSQTFNFREWIASQKGNYEYKKVDENHIQLVTSYTVAQINFHDIGEGQEEVVEFKIVEDNENEPKFFLHFQADHEEHAKELFGEFVEALEELGNQQVKEILLCCTSAFTSTYFAERLNQAAHETGLLYSFSAVSVNEVYHAGIGKYAILLAPQISYMQKQLSEVMKESMILTIPSKFFGSFDARNYLPELDHQLKGKTISKRAKIEKEIINFIESNTKCILVISVVTEARESRIYYRIYNRLEVILDDVVIKKRIKVKDIEDVIRTHIYSSSGQITIDQIGIAIPGIIDNGIVNFPRNATVDLNNGEKNGFAFQKYFEDKFNVKVHVENNTNAAAIGWGVKHHKDIKVGNIIYYSQPRGFAFGGQGIIQHGRLVKGKSSSAGEIKYIVNRFSYQNPLSFNPFNPSDMFQIVLNVVLMDIAMLNPNILCIRCDLVTDMEMLRQEVLKYVPEEAIPELHSVKNYYEHVLLGEFALCLGDEFIKGKK